MFFSNLTQTNQNSQIHIKAGNLSELVVSWLKEEILKGTYKLGDELPSEQELCDLLNVGKSSIREAMKMLKIIGIVEIQQGKRTRLCDNVSADIMMPVMFYLMLQKTASEELFEFRVMFESGVLHHLMTIISEEDLSKIAAELDRYGQLCDTGKATIDEEMVFHKLLLESCHNQYIIQIGDLMLELFKRPISNADADSHDCYHVLSDHQKIYDALAARDDEKLNDALKLNYSFYREILKLPGKEI